MTGIMAEERTAAELCPSYARDGELLEAIRHRLGVVDVDYFAFRPIAAAKADALKASLTDPAKHDAWCQDEMHLGDRLDVRPCAASTA